MAYQLSHSFVGIPDCEAVSFIHDGISKDQQTCASISQDIRATVLNVLCSSPRVTGQPDPLSTFFHMWNVPMSPQPNSSRSPHTPSPYSLHESGEIPPWQQIQQQQQQLGSSPQACLTPQHMATSSTPSPTSSQLFSPLQLPRQQLLQQFASPPEHGSPLDPQQSSPVRTSPGPVAVLNRQPLLDSSSVVKSPAQRSISPTRERRPAHGALLCSPLGPHPVASLSGESSQHSDTPAAQDGVRVAADFAFALASASAAPSLIPLRNAEGSERSQTGPAGHEQPQPATAQVQSQQADQSGLSHERLGQGLSPSQSSSDDVATRATWASWLIDWVVASGVRGSRSNATEKRQSSPKGLPRQQSHGGRSRPSSGLPPRPPRHPGGAPMASGVVASGFRRSARSGTILPGGSSGGAVCETGSAISWSLLWASLLGGPSKGARGGLTSKQLNEMWTSIFMSLLLATLFCVLLLVPGKAAL
eukprot:TRINITY_DN12531_c0_g1_i1.p1 TRINITY_DN12531_c0_g1~~TRINITY_DN12531_c0_g1_i1.p1  ORF type:complete len:474 (+),score=-37.17 TRINITY_DN12531_c0_g1_i1:180-1601(+)